MKKIFFFVFVFLVLFTLPSSAFALVARAPVEPSTKNCVRTGCSGQICADSDVVSTCEYQTRYACYKTATCERQSNGTCGWTQTEELKSCLTGGIAVPPIEVTVAPQATCVPRPSCLDSVPACKIAIRPDFCPPKTTPLPRPSCVPRPEQCNDTNAACPFMAPMAGWCPPTTIHPTKPTTTVKPKPSCMPRPSCLDSNPRCMIAEPAEGFCPPVPTKEPRPTSIPRPNPTDIPSPPVWIHVLPPPVKNFMEMLFIWKMYFNRPTDKSSLLQPSPSAQP